MSEIIINVAFPENIKLATGFKNECLSLQKAINSINASELECCYHLFKLKSYSESISLMGCNSLEDFASKYFGFKGSTVRNYARIGSLCEVKKIGNKNKVVSCYADENGNDFTRSQLNELLSISDSKEVEFAVATPEQRANYNFKELLYAGCITPKMSVKNLRRISQLLKKLGEKEIKLDTPEKVKAFLEIFATPVKVESLEFNAENMLALPDLSNVDNTGNGNTGNGNTGNGNTGNDNTGNDNTGNDNTGNDNTGNDNTGNDNTGNDNTGNDNTGNDNIDEKSDYPDYHPITESEFVSRFYNDLIAFQKMHTKEETENLLAKIANIAMNHEITE